MPHLKVRGMDKKALVENSKEIIDGLTEIIKCDRTWFTIEHMDTEYIYDGKIVEQVDDIYMLSEVKSSYAAKLLHSILEIDLQNEEQIDYAKQQSYS